MNKDKHPLQSILERITDNTRSYSGRAMYGKECLGVTVGQRGLGELISQVMEELVGLANDAMADEAGEAEDKAVTDVVQAWKRMATDSMGRDDIIVYFPGVPYFDDEAPADDDVDEDEEGAPDSENTKTLIAMGR